MRVQGRVVPLAVAFVQNRRSGKIAGQETASDGAYSVTLAAESGDRIEIWYIDGTDRSPPTIVFVPEGQTGIGGAGGSVP